MQVLSGTWQIALDPRNEGREQHWYDQAGPEAVAAPVPGLIQDLFPNYHGVAWYWHRFTPELTGLRNLSGLDLAAERLLAALRRRSDYLGEVWLNGQYAGCCEGGETPFEFDVTKAIRLDADNLLAVRVLNPADTPIDGYVLKEVPHSNRTNSTKAGSSTNMGGITYPVTLRRVPAVYVADVFARPDLHTGRIAVTVTVCNSQDAAVPGTLILSVAPDQAGEIIASIEQAVELPAGLSEHELTVQVAQPRPWDLEDPYLYRVTVEVATEGSSAHQHSVRCGFRELRVVDGYFTLNGRRIFLKSAHTGRGLRRDMLNTKAAGFNMVRFIAGVADPAQLDFCDELGLMVYEECLASWLPGRFAQDGRTLRSQHRRDDPPGPQPSLHHHLGAAERDRERPGVPAGGRFPAQAAPARPHPPGAALQWALGRRPVHRLGEQPGR